jgi:hypothetical protein
MEAGRKGGRQGGSGSRKSVKIRAEEFRKKEGRGVL